MSDGMSVMADSPITYGDGGVQASLDGGPIRITLSGGGFSDAERAAILDGLASGRVKPGDVPPGDGSKVVLCFAGMPGREPALWQVPPGDPLTVRLEGNETAG